jgi:hypothetical protein
VRQRSRSLSANVREFLLLTGNTGDGFLARKIGDMDESIIEGGENVSNTKDVLTLSYLRAERDGVLWGDGLDFLGGLYPRISWSAIV